MCDQEKRVGTQSEIRRERRSDDARERLRAVGAVSWLSQSLAVSMSHLRVGGKSAS